MQYELVFEIHAIKADGEDHRGYECGRRKNQFFLSSSGKIRVRQNFRYVYQNRHAPEALNFRRTPYSLAGDVYNHGENQRQEEAKDGSCKSDCRFAWL